MNKDDIINALTKFEKIYEIEKSDYFIISDSALVLLGVLVNCDRLTISIKPSLADGRLHSQIQNISMDATTTTVNNGIYTYYFRFLSEYPFNIVIDENPEWGLIDENKYLISSIGCVFVEKANNICTAYEVSLKQSPSITCYKDFIILEALLAKMKRQISGQEA